MRKVECCLVTVFLAVAMCVASLAGAADAPAPTQQGGVVNINTANATQLAYLPGLGPSKAQAIIDFRAKQPFKKVEDISRVKGIGRKTFLKLRPYITVSGETTAKSKFKSAS